MSGTVLAEPEPPHRPNPEPPIRVGPNMTLIGSHADPVPMRAPAEVWAWWVTAVDLDSDDQPVLLQGCWVDGPPPADGPYDGDLAVRLHPPVDADPDRVSVEMLLAFQRRWTRVGTWPNHGRDWPSVIAPTASTVMHLHTALLEADTRETRG